MPETILFLTELMGLPVFDLKQRRIGRLKDAALVPVIDPSRIDRFLVSGGGVWLSVRFDQVQSISLDAIHLSDEVLVPYHDDEYMLRLCRDLLDQQIIDVSGRKVVRVNDVTLQIRDSLDGRQVLVIQEVDVGIRSILRRLLQGVLPPRWIRRLQRGIPPSSIAWDFCDIVEPDPQRRLRLNISYQKLEKIHPADIADIVEELSPENREAIFESIDSEVAAEALSEIDMKMQASILESLEPDKAADIVEEMAPDEAADVLGELDEEASEDILEEMAHEPKSDVQELLEFKDDSAGGLMNTEYLALPEDSTVADAMAAVRASEELVESLPTIFLIDGGEKLTGSLPIARLFSARQDAPLRSLTQDAVISARLGDHQDRIAARFDKYNLLALPVVDEDLKLCGVITADDIISILREK